ncbi:hypothetical protein ACVI3U_002844 [Sinorhizobium medicae]
MRKPCKFVDIKPDARGRIVMRKDYAYPCAAPLPDVALPTSITASDGRRAAGRHITKDDCAACPCWTPREAIETNS